AIDEALQEGFSALQGSGDGRLPLLLFLTDGLPTIGETDIETILKHANDRNSGKARVFSFGVGYDVNTHLLDRLVENHRGERTYVKPEEDIEVKVSNLYEKIASPVLTDLSIECEGVRLYDLYPKAIPDLFRGSQLTLLGRFEGQGARRVVLRGKVNGKERSWSIEQDFSNATGASFLPALWAMRKVGYLLDEIRLHGENAELKDEVTRLGKRYGIATPYTSFLVVEEGELLARHPGAPAAAMPSIEERRDRLFSMNQSMEDALSKGEATGAGAQARSGMTQRFKEGNVSYMITDSRKMAESMGVNVEAERLPAGIGQLHIKRLEGKTFFLKDGVWTDSEYDEAAPQKAREIRFLSDEYFALLKAEPEIAKFLSLGEKIIVTWKGTVYKIVQED
ncbi:MAG: trypsin, partial [Planctomycetota bacterium]